MYWRMPTYTHQGGEIVAYACSKNRNIHPCPALVFQSTWEHHPTCSLMEIKCKPFGMKISVNQGEPLQLYMYVCTSDILYCKKRVLHVFTNRSSPNPPLESRFLQHTSKSAALRYSSIESIRAIYYQLIEVGLGL